MPGRPRAREPAARPARARAPLLAVALLAAPVLAGCLAGADVDPVDVLATHYPLGYLAERVAGDDVTTGTLVEGHLPHGWAPSVRDVQRIDAADLYVAQGAGFDPWLADVAANLGSAAPPVVDTTKGVDLLVHDGDGGDEAPGDDDGHDHGGTADVDPHTWQDPVRFRVQARAVEAAMVQRWPEHADGFHARADALVEDLDALDRDHRRALDTCEVRVIVVNHDAFAYLGHRYNVTVEAVHGLSPSTEPSAATLDRLARLVDRHGLDVVFFEEFVDPGVVEMLARETGTEARVLSPLEGLTPDQRDRDATYLTVMRANLAKLADAMGCAP